MWGFDWPVYHLEVSHGELFVTVHALATHLPADAKDRIIGGTAKAFYRH